jgi:Tol biopolymer transport system component
LRIVIFISMWCVMGLAAPNTESEAINNYGKQAYISTIGGNDAIVVMDGGTLSVLYNCVSQNEIILTPQLSLDGNYISFLIDAGGGNRQLHLLGPLQQVNGKWRAQDELVTEIASGAWPSYGRNSDFYLTLPAHDLSQYPGASNIYQLMDGKFSLVNENRGGEKHLWPLISPEGNKIHYRKVSKGLDMAGGGQLSLSILYDLESEEKEEHLANQNIFVEQWSGTGQLLYSQKINDNTGTRVYSLYDPKTRESQVILETVSRQARLSPDGRYLMTLRAFPEGNNHYDIFIVDLQTKTETNLTQTEHVSESLIDWIR